MRIVTLLLLWVSLPSFAYIYTVVIVFHIPKVIVHICSIFVPLTDMQYFCDVFNKPIKHNT